jgi:hypothetical protein
MSTPAPATSAAPKTSPKFNAAAWLKPYLTVYHVAIASAIGAATAGFLALIVVLIIIATNFNVLGLIE